jgi:murein DD-endopeptidase MepM/ murein hydrolase activator NlpD
VAHSPVRRNNASFMCAVAAIAAMFATTGVSAKDSKSSDKTTDPKRPVAVASTVPSNSPVAIEAGDGTDDVDRADDSQAFLGGPGWVCPVPGSTLRNDWGNPRSGGRRHQGTDMFAPIGTPILAPVSGTVKRYEGGNAGLAFYLAGSDGVQYFGAHLSALSKVGAVRAGEVIGQVGDSGNARGGSPHLHFEIHPTKKTKTNPYPTLAAQCASVATVK